MRRTEEDEIIGRLFEEAVVGGLLVVSLAPPIGGALDGCGDPKTIPEQAVLYANFGGVRVRLAAIDTGHENSGRPR